MFLGSMVALVTPMHEDGEIDYTRLCELVEWHIAEGTHAIVAVGTTGESGMINAAERLKVISAVVEQTKSRVPVIAGSGSTCTQTSIKHTHAAMEQGVDACLLMAPAYVKPTQEGLYQHYKTIAEAVAVPQILYNVPSRTACDILPETVGRLSQVPNIVGIKEATGDIHRVREIQAHCQDNLLDIYSGDDLTALDLIKAGAKGVISVTANVAPGLMAEMVNAALEGDHHLANSIDQRLTGLHKELFVEANPIPTKWALAKMNKIEGDIRLPLTQLSTPCQQGVSEAMRQAGIEVAE